MKNLKHVGKMANTGSRVVVVFRTIPGESNMALVLLTETLSDDYHEALMKLVETEEAQQSFEFGEIMFVRMFPDGRPMLRAMQAENRLQKVPTDKIIMTPTPTSQIPLDQLNVLIAEQKNCTVDELCTFVKGATKSEDSVKEVATVNETIDTEEPVRAQAKDNSVLSDKDLAKSYRSQADAMYKEAARLRREADELDPPQKKTVKAKEAEDA